MSDVIVNETAPQPGVVVPTPVRPPVGLKPRRIYDEERFQDIIAAIARHEWGKMPLDWLEELADLCDRRTRTPTQMKLRWLTTDSGSLILVNVGHITRAFSQPNGGTWLAFPGSESDEDGDINPSHEIVKESLEEIYGDDLPPLHTKVLAQ